MTCMRQLNLNVTADFERDLRQFMKQKKIASKSEAIREALHEAVARGTSAGDYDFRTWLGMGLKAPLRRKGRFRSEDDLWL